MTARSSARIAIVQAAQQGSGYLISPRLVLTSGHLFGTNKTAQVAVPGGTGVHTCRILWRRHDDVCDGALLLASTDLVDDASQCNPEDIKWGTLSGISARENCEAVGYPSISRIDEHLPDTEQLVGTLKPGSSIIRGRYVLDSSHSAPRPRRQEDTPWLGMSGAAVFTENALVALVSGDPVKWSHARVEAVPITALTGDADFCHIVEQHTGRSLTTVEVHHRSDHRYLNAPVWHPVTESDAVTFGVHRVQEVAGHSKSITYIAREIDSDVDRTIQTAADIGGVVLLTGDSAAGKTRTLFEAMRRTLSEWLVCKPDPEDDLAYLLDSVNEQRRLIWLDDLHSYLRSDGLSPRLLDELTRRRCVLLSTMRSEFYDDYTGMKAERFSAGSGAPRMTDSASRVLRAAMRIPIKRTWSTAERERAIESDDPRVSQALEADKSYGVAEYLAAGPQVLALCHSANRAGGNPRGAALVAAAVDLARTGLDLELPADALEDLHETYLEEAGGYALRPETLEEAWSWAQKIALGVTSPLIPARAGRWRPFDYIVSDKARHHDPRSLSDEVWEVALQVVNDSRRYLLSSVARVAGRPDTAKRALLPLTEEDDIEALNQYGAILVGEGDYTGASQWFLRAVALGDGAAAHNMGSIFMLQESPEQALQWFSMAVERGELQSIGNLGLVHERLGDKTEAVRLWKSGTEAGDPGSAWLYSDWLHRQWESDTATKVLKVAADGGIPFAALSYAGIELARDAFEKANEYIALAYDNASRLARFGDGTNAILAGVANYVTGNIQGGDYWWRRARENGVEAEWTILRSHEGDSGLRYLAVSNETLDVLGEPEVRLLMQGLWAGNCADCGKPIGKGVPALLVNDMIVMADARLHHFALCRYPRWNDTGLTTLTKGSTYTWRAYAGIAGRGRSDTEATPILIVNPSLEATYLIREDSGGWTITRLYGPRSALGKELGIQPVWRGTPPTLSQEKCALYIRPNEMYVAHSAGAWGCDGVPDEVIDCVKEKGGVLLICTSGYGLGPERSDLLQHVMECWDTMVGWVPIHEILES